MTSRCALSSGLIALLTLLAGCGGGGGETAAPADATPVIDGEASADDGAGSGDGAAAGDEDGAVDGPAAPATTAERASGRISSAGPAGSSFQPPERSDGLILVFEDDRLGPVLLGATRAEVEGALGPDFQVTPVETIRAGFPAGYSVSREGEVLFWAVEEDGRTNLFMTNHPQVGLDSGLRPTLALADAIELHGEPTLWIGTEQREFASFADGTGLDGSVSVLVAIGEFGGPVGLYDGPGGQELAEADGYVLDDANVKELWFGQLAT